MAGPRVYYPAARAILQVVLEGVEEGEGSEDRPLVITVHPREFRVVRNGPRQADSYEMTFDAGDLPVDPQQIRAGQAEIYLFQLPTLRGQPRLGGKVAPLPDDVDAIERNEDTASARDRFTMSQRPLVIGLFDQQDLDLGEDGRWVTISGQDYTAHLAAKQWPPTPRGTARRIPVGKRLDRTLRDMLAEVDPSGRLALEVENVPESDLPTVGAGEVAGNGRGIAVVEDTSYWDVMHKVAGRYGFILFVRGLSIVLTRPKNQRLASHQIKFLAWGKNLATVKLSRRLGKERAPRIILRGYDQAARNTISVEFPGGAPKGKAAPILKGKPSDRVSVTDKPAKKTKTAGQQLRATDEYQIIPVFGITDRVVLQRLAETLHDKLTRGERRVVATTRDLRDSEGHDLLDVFSGDAVQVDWLDIDRGYVARADVPEPTKVQYLVSRGYDPQVAQVLAKHHTQLIDRALPMLAHEVTFEYSVDDGVTIEFDLIDFVADRGEKSIQRTPSDTRRDRVRDGAGNRIGDPLIHGGGR